MDRRSAFVPCNQLGGAQILPSNEHEDFMNISTSKYERQQFSHPGEGGILGMGCLAGTGIPESLSRNRHVLHE